MDGLLFLILEFISNFPDKLIIFVVMLVFLDRVLSWRNVLTEKLPPEEKKYSPPAVVKDPNHPLRIKPKENFDQIYIIAFLSAGILLSVLVAYHFLSRSIKALEKRLRATDYDHHDQH